jgi:hypothetical protein
MPDTECRTDEECLHDKQCEIQDNFHAACRDGKIEWAGQWLTALMELLESNDFSKFGAFYRKGFAVSCEAGQLEMAKWFLRTKRLSGKKVDIHGYLEEPFRLACKNGYLEVAKWLVSLSKKGYTPIDIDLIGDLVIHTARQTQYDEMVIWLKSLYPQYQSDEEDEKDGAIDA